LAARGDLEGAIEQYERATRMVPDPALIAALGDLYKTVGRDKDADAQYSLVEMIAALGSAGGQLYSRQMAVYYADHDLKSQDAYLIASKEYESRRDVYGADAVAWTALKSGRIAEAQSAIKLALRLGTKDARILYHAGMIYHAAGDNASARNYIELALKLNPQFDPIQAVAGKTLEVL
jgi:Flp pilus assembly protein TadD